MSSLRTGETVSITAAENGYIVTAPDKAVRIRTNTHVFESWADVEDFVAQHFDDREKP